MEAFCSRHWKFWSG